MKTPVIIMVLLMAAAASAASLQLENAQLYEASNQKIELSLNNYLGAKAITSIIAKTDFEITSADDYIGWNTTRTEKTVRWTGGTVETNVKSAIFGFNGTLPKVDQNKNTIINVTLGTDTAKINLTILNDQTPPEITDVKPEGYVAANQSNVLVEATIFDDETGIEKATYTWSDCTGPTTTITLVKSGNKYVGNASFTGTSEGSTACYELKATNNGGETARINGTLTFDGTAPTVVLNSPLSLATENTNFSFTATDNIAEELECELKLGNKSLANVTAENGTITIVEQDLSGFSDGMTTWKVICRDGVGLTASSNAAITLDTQGPEITDNAPSAIPREQEVEFTITATDASGVESVAAKFKGKEINLTQSGDNYQGMLENDELGEYNLTITAKDNAGHETSQTKTINIVKNHKVGLALSPSTAKPEQTVKAWGSITADGNLSNTTVRIILPDETKVLDLDDKSYSTTFEAPSQGSYEIVVEYEENGITYRTDSTLTVQSGTSSIQQPIEGSHGQGFDAWRYSGSIADKDEDESGEETSSSEQQEVSSNVRETEEQEYEPIQPSQPRQALTPKATGIFTLDNVINWLAVLLALAIIAGLGVYAYKKKKPKDPWEQYFGR